MSITKAEVAVFVGELPFNLEADIDAVRDYGLKKVRICDGHQATADIRFEKTYATDLWSEDALLRCVDELVEAFEPRLVLTFSEVTVVPAGFIGERLGVAGLPLGVANRCRNKFLMRRAFVDALMPVPEFRLIDSTADLADLQNNMSGFPLICKPVLGFASQGVRRVDNEEELERALRLVKRENRHVMHRYYQLGNEQFCSKVLIESFIQGREVGVDGIVCDGDVSILLEIDKPDVSDGPYFGDSLHIAPARLSATERQDLTAAVEAAIRSVGMTHGPFHLEARIDPNGKVYVIELGARIGFPRLIRLSRDLDIVAIAQRALLGDCSHRSLSLHRFAGNYCINADRAGRYRRIVNLDEMRGVPGVIDIPVFVHAGEKVSPPPLGNKYIGFVIAAAETYREVAEALDFVKNNMQLEIQ